MPNKAVAPKLFPFWTNAFVLAVLINEAVKAFVAQLAVPNKEPVNEPLNDPLNDPVFDKNWSTRFAVRITEGIPGCVPEIGSASNLKSVSVDIHII